MNSEQLTQTPEQKAKMVQTWLAFSATNIVFDHKGNLILGVLTDPTKKSIPEAGDTCLNGGFNNGLVEGPTMFKDLADAHLKNQLGLTVSPEQCSDFIPCEYNMAEIYDPLKTPFGNFYIKRVAFDRFVQLTEAQTLNILPAGKIKSIKKLSLYDFKALIFSAKDVRFEHQIKHILDGFKWANPSPFNKFRKFLISMLS
ncbi:MAG: hypothetical protein ACI9TY_001474 [Alphaproteobacteria bacterium]|jgi:hypothetical protein